MPESNDKVLRVTLEETEQVTLPVAAPAPQAQKQAEPGARNYGNINAAEPAAPTTPEERGTFLLQGWFYLGTAGVLSTLIAWALAEPGFVDGEGKQHWGNIIMLPLVVLMMCSSFAIAESLVERSVKKAAIRLAIALPLGVVLGFIFDIFANIIYTVALGVVWSVGIHTERNPAWWIARGLAWMVFGAAGGLIYGIVGKSAKKGRYGVYGGLLGAGLGGVLFDPIALAVQGGAPSRAVGFALVGLATGVAIGFVESALKDRWLYVSAGPLAGKQFILYKPVTIIGSQQQSDIYLFKDPSIAPQHASIELRGSQVLLRSATPIYVSGVPTQSKVLQNGDSIQIGRYAFRYHERHKS
jgi:FtsH-binding integral membrane protein